MFVVYGVVLHVGHKIKQIVGFLDEYTVIGKEQGNPLHKRVEVFYMGKDIGSRNNFGFSILFLHAVCGFFGEEFAKRRNSFLNRKRGDARGVNAKYPYVRRKISLKQCAVV